MEVIELPSNSFFMGTQYHPEFKSAPACPHPLFTELIKKGADFASKRDLKN